MMIIMIVMIDFDTNINDSDDNHSNGTLLGTDISHPVWHFRVDGFPSPVWWDMLVLWMLIPKIITILVLVIGNRCQKPKHLT